MKPVLFYEKPGCATNAKQKRQLQQAGCIVFVRDLLNNGLTEAELYAFLEPLHVSAWFNPNAPKIKNGEIDISALSREQALKMLMREPILIRRPLMVIGNRKFCGYDAEAIAKVLEKAFDNPVGESCSGEHDRCAEASTRFYHT